MAKASGEFAGKSILVTGAGKGIGRAIATMAAQRGATIVAVSRSAEDLESLAGEISCRTFAVDLADAKRTREVAHAAQPADYLVNCAGVAILEPVLEMSEATFDTLMAVNARSAFVFTQEYARARVAAGQGGAIVNVSSISAVHGFANHAGYCASKGAMDGMSRVMANELGRLGIRVNCVNPGVTLTAMARKAWSDPVKAGPMLARMPLGRFLEPEEVAEVVLYLLSDRSAMINGVSMPIDAGFGAV